jgi:hypothetical protein
MAWSIGLLASSSGGVTINYVGGKSISSASFGSATSATVALNSGLTGGINSDASVGDLVIVGVASGVNTGLATSPLTPPTGYTTIANLSSRAIAGDDLYFNLSYKYLTAADANFTVSGFLSLATTIAVQVWRGVSPTTPLDVTPTTVIDQIMLPSAPAITPVTLGAVIVSAIAIGSDTENAVFTQSVMSNLVTIGDPDATNQESHIGMASAYWEGGTYTPTGWATNDADSTGSGAAVTLALRPA